jgi:hypothetical protein
MPSENPSLSLMDWRRLASMTAAKRRNLSLPENSTNPLAEDQAADQKSVCEFRVSILQTTAKTGTRFVSSLSTSFRGLLNVPWWCDAGLHLREAGKGVETTHVVSRIVDRDL